MSAYRLGIDLGVNSLGWCALKLGAHGEPCGILDAGVRLFTDGRDPKTGTSLAADRRIARQMRRRRDRYLGRRKDLMAALVRHGLMPSDKSAAKHLESLDPYELRAKGLDAALTPHEFGRAIFHLHQRRGFKSSRKNLAVDEKETGLIDAGIARLREQMAATGARTVGEYLARRHGQREAVRVRLQGAKKDAHYDFYPQRALLEEEFHTLWSAQAMHRPALTEAARAEIAGIMFHQRPLRPVIPGRCTLDPNERRAPWALPLAQRFRIYQELANLRIEMAGQPSVTLDHRQRDTLFEKLERKPKLTFKKMRQALKLDSNHRFNLESENRDALTGDVTGLRLASDKLFGQGWWNIDPNQQAVIVETILTTDDEEKLARIAHEDWRLAESNAQAVARVAPPDGYANIGRTAMAKIVPIIIDQGLGYYDAAKAAGYEPSDFRGDGSMAGLPYYGELLDRAVIGDSGDPNDPIEKQFGRFPNPTVHIGLNQIREVVNALIKTHGKPDEIVIELARELKQNKKQKDAHNKRVAADQAHNEDIAGKLSALGVENHALNRKTYKLWEELGPPEDRRCIYTGKVIAAHMIFSGATAIDHILPFSRTLDDGMANLLLCMREANEQKTNKTPFEAFADTAGWEDIRLRIDKLPANKQWRFAADAMETWRRDHADFIARNLTDTQWVARAAKEYLGAVCHSDRVWATPGRLTALLRGKWGLNAVLQYLNRGVASNDPQAGETDNLAGIPKNRDDHRHHAVDAFVIASTGRGMLQRVATAAARSGPDRIIADMPDPWPGFRDELKARIATVVVSLKPDHGRQGKLHEATAYGLVKEPNDWDGNNVVYRKAFADLNEKEIERIRDPLLRAAVAAHVGTVSGAALKTALATFKGDNGVTPRRIRLLKKEEQVIRVADRHTGQPYKALIPGENWCIDIFEQPDGKWRGAAVTMFDANAGQQLDEKRKGHPAARRVMRVHKGDYLKLVGADGRERVMRVVRLRVKAQQFMLAEHKEAGDLDERHKEKSNFQWLFASFNTLKKMKARKVGVDVLGRVRDPGPLMDK